MKFSIPQKAVLKKNNEVVNLIDYEVFDTLILYYTDDKKAYPEEELGYYSDFLLNNEKVKEMFLKHMTNELEEECHTFFKNLDHKAFHKKALSIYRKNNKD